jgi:diacylglycerol kinase family enzyme
MAGLPSIVVILNAAAGTVAGQSQVVDEVRTLFGEAGLDAEVRQVPPGQDVTAVAREASARAAVVVAAGGDGTVRSVVVGIEGSAASLGVLPLGTLNHFAKDLRIPPALRDAVAVVADRYTEPVDVGEVNGHLFVNNSSIGVYPSVVEEREALRRQGHRKWAAMAMATWRVLRRHSGVTVRVDADGVPARTCRTPFIFVGNNEYALEGLALGGRARLDGGRLFAYLAPRSRTRDLPWLVVKALIGRAVQSGAFEIVAASELRIDIVTAKRIRVACDGEVVTLSRPLHYRIRPRALRVVVPRR